ncbi:MAG: rhomboid family intramembrane serine protease [Lacibacter sp.]|nr:rhomboid family intramembrane serine protease [Lacibacter sp.]
MARYNAMNEIPPVVKNLLAINIVIWLAQIYFQRQGSPLEIWGALWSFESGNFKIWQVVSHMFMHGPFFHILFNMLTLWIFGRVLENFWGSKRFLNFYLICGIAAAAAQLAVGHFTVAIGASGAIMGLMAAFAYLFPNTELMFMFIPVPIKAKFAIPALMAFDLFGGIANVQGDNVAHFAHLGGAVAGFLLVLFWNKKNRNTFY